MIPYMIYAGKNLRTDMMTVVDFSTSFGNPERSYEYVEIMGKDGSLVIDNDRFNDIEIDFPAFILKDFISNYRKLMAFLNSKKGYQRMETSHEPNHFRKALFLGTVQPEPTQFLKKGSFTLPFRVHPQRWLKIGEEAVEMAATDEILNPTLYNARPLLRIYGAGELVINTQHITIAANPYSYIDLDCELMDATYESNNANQYVTIAGGVDYVELAPGLNGIEYTDITKVEITPHWWEV